MGFAVGFATGLLQGVDNQRAKADKEAEQRRQNIFQFYVQSVVPQYIKDKEKADSIAQFKNRLGEYLPDLTDDQLNYTAYTHSDDPKAFMQGLHDKSITIDTLKKDAMDKAGVPDVQPTITTNPPKGQPGAQPGAPAGLPGFNPAQDEPAPGSFKANARNIFTPETSKVENDKSEVAKMFAGLPNADYFRDAMQGKDPLAQYRKLTPEGTGVHVNYENPDDKKNAEAMFKVWENVLPRVDAKNMPAFMDGMNDLLVKHDSTKLKATNLVSLKELHQMSQGLEGANQVATAELVRRHALPATDPEHLNDYDFMDEVRIIAAGPNAQMASEVNATRRGQPGAATPAKTGTDEAQKHTAISKGVMGYEQLNPSQKQLTDRAFVAGWNYPSEAAALKAGRKPGDTVIIAGHSGVL